MKNTHRTSGFSTATARRLFIMKSVWMHASAALAVFLVLGAQQALALTAGDIAIIGANSDNPVKVTWVALVDIPANTKITFTDNGWLAGGGWRTGEGSVEWSHNAPVAAGTVVYMNSLENTANTTSVGTLARNGSFNLATSGDQVLVFEGTWAAAPATGSDPRWLYAFSLTDFSDATSAGTSALPAALAGASLATGDIENAWFTTSAVSGTKAELLALFTYVANFTKNNTPSPHPAYTILVQAEGEDPVELPIFTLTPSPLADVTELETMSFTIGATMTNVAVEVACLTTLPSGASYTYDGAAGFGTFTWTTARGDAGGYSLDFRALASDGSPQTNTVSFKVKEALPEGSVALFEDDFSYATGGSLGSPSSSAWSVVPEQYTVATRIYDAGGSVKFGTSSLGGTLTTTNMNIRAGSVTVQVDAIGYDADEKEFIITLAGQSFTRTCTSLKESGVFDTIRLDFTVAATGYYPLTISTVDGKRIIIGNIVVSQVVTETAGTPEFSFTPAVPASVMELDAISFNVSASVNGNPTNVVLTSAMPSGASYSYSVEANAGAFNWTPELGQAGDYSFTFGAYGEDGELFSTLIPIKVIVLPLSAPAGLITTNVTYNSFDAEWEGVPGAHGYIVNIWSGSSSTNSPGVDLEEFIDSVSGKVPVAPYGWSFTKLGSSYTDASLKFDDPGSVIVSKTYPKAVTQLSFYLKGNSTATTNHSIFRVYASIAGTEAADWTEVASYDSYTGGAEAGPTNIVTSGEYLDKVVYLEANAGYRKFKFTYERTQGNVAFDTVAAVYEGSGTKFLGDWRDKPVSAGMTELSVANARPEEFYNVMVGAVNDVERLDARTYVVLGVAPKETILTIR